MTVPMKKILTPEELQKNRDKIKEYIQYKGLKIRSKDRNKPCLCGSGKKAKSSTKSPSDANSINESPINISFVSGFNQFASFVNSLERHRPVILVHEFKLDRSNQDKSAYQITLDVRALVRKQQETEIAELSSAQLYSVKR